MRPTRPLVLAALAAVVVGLTPPAASAHDLKGEAKVSATQVKIVAGYDDDTPADGGKVVVTAADGAKVAEGVLDETGTWVMPAPPPGKYRVVVNAVGHRDRFEFEVKAPTPEEPQPAEVTYTSWRLDKTLGLTIGLGLLLGGSLLYAVFRRKPAAPGAGPPA
jgi:hypothetical protein